MKKLLLIIALALALRIFVLFHIGDFIWDEMFSFTYSQRPWLESIGLWIYETNPPLHLAFLKLWWFFFPASEFWARLPSVLFGAGTVAAIYVAGKKFFNERVALTAAGLLTLAPYHLMLSSLARGYTLLLLLATLSMYWFYKIFVDATVTSPPVPSFLRGGENSSPPLSKRGGRGGVSQMPLVLLSLANVFLLFTHLTGIYIILIETVLIVVAKRDKLRHWILVSLPLLIPAIWIALSFYAKRLVGNAFTSAWFFNLQPTFNEGLAPFKLLFFGPHYTAWSIGLAALFFIALIVAVFRCHPSFEEGEAARPLTPDLPAMPGAAGQAGRSDGGRGGVGDRLANTSPPPSQEGITPPSSPSRGMTRQPPNRKVLIAKNLAAFTYLIPFLLIPLLTALVLQLWNIKFFIISLPALVLLFAYLLNYYLRHPLIIGTAVLCITIPSIYFLTLFLPYSNWSIPNTYIQSKHSPSKKQLFVYTDPIEKLLVDRYYRASTPALPYAGDSLNLNWDQRLILTNYLTYEHTQTELDQWYIKNNLDAYEEIFVLYTPRVQVELPKFLETRGWQLKEATRHSPIDDSRDLLYYARE